MYHYANRPGLSTERSRLAITDSFNTSVNGLPGNDGAYSRSSVIRFSPFLCSRLWSYGELCCIQFAWDVSPPRTRQMLISSPFFPRVSIFNPLYNTTTTIRVNGFKGNPLNVTGQNIYVKVRSPNDSHPAAFSHIFHLQKITIDGKP